MGAVPLWVVAGVDLRRVMVAEVLVHHKITLVLLVVVFVILVLVVGAEELRDSGVDSVLHVVIVERPLIRAVDVAEDELVTQLRLEL